MRKIEVLYPNWQEYELIDSGNLLKLERFGSYTVIRSEPKAWWKPSLDLSEWKKLSIGQFLDEEKKNSKWSNNMPKPFVLNYKNAFKIKARFLDTTKHLGIFPEQSPHWDFIIEKGKTMKNPKLLNLFGYTGAASLAALSAGYSCTHIDASKPAIALVKENQALNNFTQKPLRTILEDALKYVKREAKRGSFYDAIVLDPPSFGRGPNKEVWKIQESLYELLTACKQILNPENSFVLMTIYNLEASSVMAGNLLEDTLSKGEISIGELCLKASRSKNDLPLSLWAKWQA